MRERGSTALRFRQQYLGVGFVSGRQEPNGPPAGRMTILAVNHLPGVSPRIKGALLRTNRSSR